MTRTWNTKRYGIHDTLRAALMARVIVTSGCWNTDLRQDHNGYRRFWWQGRRVRLHVASWLVHHGPIPKGLLVLHKCDVPHCANPAHLFLGTNLDNTRDMFAKGRARPARGEQRSNLTEDQVRAIRRDPRSQRVVGLAYGIATSTVGGIRQRVNWAHVGD